MLLDLLFPKACLSCQKYGAYICEDCATKITRHNQTCIVCGHISLLGITHKECLKHTPLDGAIIPTEYQNLTRTALHQIKYKMNFAIVSELLEKTVKRNKIKACLQEQHFDISTEVPMHKFKENKRGFNQAILIAKWIEKEYGILHQSVLRKTKHTTAQMHLKREERIFNVKNVFEIKSDITLENKNILLIDDVTTTASTLEECAKILKENNASKVWALVIAGRR